MNYTIFFCKKLIFVMLRHVPIVNKHHVVRKKSECSISACKIIFNNQRDLHSVKTKTIIRQKLMKLGVNFDNLPNSLKNDLLLLFGNTSFTETQYNDLKIKLNNISYNSLSCRQWLNLCEMSCFNGKFTLAKIFRDKALDLAVSPFKYKNIAPPINWLNSISAAIEKGIFKEHSELDAALKKHRINKKLTYEFNKYFSLINDKIVESKWHNDPKYNDYSAYLNNKTIALVGPAAIKDKYALEIDSNNIVCRLNYSYSGKGTDSISKGLKTDITIFNGQNANSFLKNFNGILADELSWSCFKGNRMAKLIQKKNNHKRVRALTTMFDDIIFHGSLNLIPIAAMDFAQFNPSKIKIYHTDLMLTVLRQKGYDSNSYNLNDKKLEFKKSSVTHDPIVQFFILNRLWENHKITGDNKFNNIMKKGLDSYLQQLEFIYN